MEAANKERKPFSWPWNVLEGNCQREKRHSWPYEEEQEIFSKAGLHPRSPNV